MKTFLRFIGIAVLVLIGAGAALAGYTFYDINAGASATDLTNVSIPHGDVTLNAYIASPAEEGIYPAVIMIHEWWGLRPDIITKADRLAQEGYVVMAIDAYRGTVATSIPGAIFNTLNYPQARIDEDMRAFHAHLVGLPNVDPTRVAVMGYCFGGRQSVQFAVENPSAVNVLMTYYGGGQIRDEAGLAPLATNNIAVLGVFGEEDSSIPMEDYQQFTDALVALGLPHQVTVYPDVGHAFVKDLDAPGASREAWLEGIAFLNAYLQPQEA